MTLLNFGKGNPKFTFQIILNEKGVSHDIYKMQDTPETHR